MLKIILFFSCFILCFGQNEISVFNKNQTSERANIQSNNKKTFSNIIISEEELNAIAKNSENEQNLDFIQKKQKPFSIKLNTKLLKKEAFIYEPFGMDISLKTDTLKGFNFSIDTDTTNIKLLSTKTEFKNISKSEAVARLLFVATNKEADIKNISVIVKRGGEFIFRDEITPKLPVFKELAFKENFSNVLASDLQVKNFKATKFDDFNNVINFDLEIKNGNLSEFNIPIKNIKQGVENIKGGIENMSANYFLIIPNSVKNISFSYFNTNLKTFSDLEFAIKPTNLGISTQTDLNPQTSEFATYKTIILFIIALLCLLSFMLWRSYYGLVFALFFGAFAIYDARPFSNVEIQAGSAVRILPTKNSSIFYKTLENESAKKMDQKQGYTKVLLQKDNAIGWVRDENIK